MILSNWDHRVLDVITIIQEYTNEVPRELSVKDDLIPDILSIYNSQHSDIILVYTDGVISGGAIVQQDTIFTNETNGYIYKFYIRKQFRGTTSARELLAEVMEWFIVRGCRSVYTTATAGFGSDKLFENLVAKVGFKTVGVCMENKLCQMQ